MGTGVIGNNFEQQDELQGGAQDQAREGDHGEASLVHGVGVKGTHLSGRMSCGKKRQHSGSFIIKGNEITSTNNVAKLIMKYEGWAPGLAEPSLEDYHPPAIFMFSSKQDAESMESPQKKRRLEGAGCDTEHHRDHHHGGVEPPEQPASSPSQTESRGQALGAGRRQSTCQSPSSSGLSRRNGKGTPRQATARRWTGRPLSRGGTQPEAQSLASRSTWTLHKPEMVLLKDDGEDVPPPPPGVHPPQTVWTEIFSSCSSSSE